MAHPSRRPVGTGRLTAAGLLADSYWTAATTAVFPVPEHDRGNLLTVAEELLKVDAF
ncbi:hypothetical protein [Rhodococcus opacus]|uniref:hypothetical protein n=1 Tax=Rhodococcus opacus TaxID=37919 RepID=UPI0012DB5B84|nr:hypothetical protein [Rhodococcus opacus]